MSTLAELGEVAKAARMPKAVEAAAKRVSNPRRTRSGDQEMIEQFSNQSAHNKHRLKAYLAGYGAKRGFRRAEADERMAQGFRDIAARNPQWGAGVSEHANEAENVISRSRKHALDYMEYGITHRERARKVGP